jgi:hypothetical protein
MTDDYQGPSSTHSDASRSETVPEAFKCIEKDSSVTNFFRLGSTKGRHVSVVI